MATPRTDGDTPERLFFAMLPDAAARHALASLASDVARDVGGRAPHPRNLHVTVAFVGEVPRDRVTAVQEIGGHAATIGEPFTLVLDQLGMFRGTGIAWVAPAVVPPSLVRIFDALQDGLGAHNLRVERREFHPHVTLARRCRRRLAAGPAPPIAWQVEMLVLMASAALPEGPRYTGITSWGLASP